MYSIKPPASDKWLVFVINLPSTNTALRMRIWRAMKALGCAVMRDGVYLLPTGRGLRQALRVHAEEIKNGGGNAYLLNVATSSSEEKHLFQSLFDRSSEYQALLEKINAFHEEYAHLDTTMARRQLKVLRRELEGISSIDYFPKPLRFDAEDRLAEAETAFLALLSPGLAKATGQNIVMHDIGQYQECHWVTLKPLTADRIASAWLIRRFIDHQASFGWLEPFSETPSAAAGFAYDTAEFPGTKKRTAFEFLLQSFGLNEDKALERVAQLVHFLEIGGTLLPEAAGIERILKGARRNSANDDMLVEASSRALDLLYASYTD